MLKHGPCQENLVYNFHFQLFLGKSDVDVQKRKNTALPLQQQIGHINSSGCIDVVSCKLMMNASQQELRPLFPYSRKGDLSQFACTYL